MAVDPNFIVQVGSCRPAGHSNRPDLIPTGHDLARLDHVLSIVAVRANNAITMCNHYKITETFFRPRKDNHPVGRGKNRCSNGRGDIETLVQGLVASEGRNPFAEA